MNKAHNTYLIKQKAQELGFMYCGISKADFLEEEAPRLENWLKQNMHGQMRYMENHFDKRLDPRLLVEGAKSVVSLLLNYYPEKEKQQAGEDTYKVSKYAYGTDYHFVIKDKLKTLLNYINEEIGEVGGRCFVDSAPVLDKAWASKSGLGWVGKHTLLITPQAGSFHFVAELIIDLELEYDGPIKDYCGSCTRCLDACPTDAIVAPYVVDGSKCISYFTIELKDQLPQEMNGKFGNWIFGCDICQDVCPWNRFSKPHQEPAFEPHPHLKEMKKSDWEEITQEVFAQLFKKSAVKRTGYNGLQRNIRFVEQSPGSHT
ncbi:tRNA epoxyqueuosine(34) reductase QueG [Pontibacter sp. HSC-14F20]|uniref:tRNA epoxyqueuosine(34) reductase QueG n=1 Tax=Pontibacter sp. HSC-14F20 TaxID=2864136 RepID=UPI001C73A5DE|nr:tRNA epoxyqueuosine(34) reductase QueG [Pontibacter sp. HSC-14F20]MBX0334770.1 tRNA epoxyqueuosine(34) reductase QueG [Pontibacter sp. HSC-14F20]